MLPDDNLPVRASELASLLIKTRTISTDLDAHRPMEKADRDVVTEADLRIEQYLQGALPSLLLDSTVLSEESSHPDIRPNDVAWIWRLDPVDGTINYSRDLPFYSTAVSLELDGTAVMCAVYLPEQNQVVVAERGKGVTRFLHNHENELTTSTQCMVRSRPINQTLTCVMLTPKMSTIVRSMTTDLIEFLIEHTQGVRILVSQAFEAAALSQGHLDAVISLQSREGWTKPTAQLLAVEAGGTVKSFTYLSPPHHSGFFLAGSPEISSMLTDWLMDHGYGD